ncbi:hypothetical protein CYLTODRAFT_457481 [Cylindrobasidium torrendii FP15055 ss-10]|uniref:MYND-type domain-containing protein n=1 Tax=Cylindrobasidium torrendii FP15055 ss-10 TaxID=1314674 RepID=A0A0D7B0W2_9AGAR|nr:hypothetical protein CYLTODRAFT_457481 [Cylindrobasidium torrendii FP15055 ss-10]
MSNGDSWNPPKCGQRHQGQELLPTTLADAFVQSLGAPKPRHPPKYYLGFLHLVEHEPDNGHWFLRYRRPDVLRTIYMFVTDYSAVQATPTPLRFPSGDIGNDAAARIFGDCAPRERRKSRGNTLAIRLCAALAEGLRFRGDVSSQPNASSRRAWPAEDGSDLWQRPLEQALCALWETYQACELQNGCHHILDAMTAMYYAVSPIHRIPLPLHLIPDFHTDVSSAMSRLEYSEESTNLFAVLRSIGLLLSTGMPDLSDRLHEVVLDGIYDALFITQVMSSYEAWQARMEIARAGGHLIKQHHATLDCRRYPATLIAQPADLPPVIPYAGAYCAIAVLSLQTTCFRRGCDKPASGRCQGCKVAQYCSSRCQSKDWKHRRMPHKVLCAPLAEYNDCMTQYGVNWLKKIEGVDRMVADSRAAGITLEEAEVVYRIAVLMSEDRIWDAGLREVLRHVRLVLEPKSQAALDQPAVLWKSLDASPNASAPLVYDYPVFINVSPDATGTWPPEKEEEGDSSSNADTLVETDSSEGFWGTLLDTFESMDDLVPVCIASIDSDTTGVYVLLSLLCLAVSHAFRETQGWVVDNWYTATPSHFICSRM